MPSLLGFFRKKPLPVAAPPAAQHEGPPLTAEEFINKFRRNYVNYAALIEVAFGLSDEMFEQYDRLSDADRKVVVRYAREWAQRA